MGDTNQNDQLKTPAEADRDMAEVAENEKAPAESGSESGGSKRASVDSLGGARGGKSDR